MLRGIGLYKYFSCSHWSDPTMWVFKSTVLALCTETCTSHFDVILCLQVVEVGVCKTFIFGTGSVGSHPVS